MVTHRIQQWGLRLCFQGKRFVTIKKELDFNTTPLMISHSTTPPFPHHISLTVKNYKCDQFLLGK